MLEKIISAILSDSDFFKKPILQSFPEADKVPETLQPVYRLLYDFFNCLTGKNELNRAKEDNTVWAETAEFLWSGIPLIKKEWAAYSRQNSAFRKAQSELVDLLENSLSETTIKEKVKHIQNVFFPQGSALWDEKNRSEQERTLRARRTVHIKRANPQPISNPAGQILFTSNVLVTLPLKGSAKNLSPHLQELLKKIRTEEQKYWYDHPIPLGIAPEKNEALYGMRGLDDMMSFEKKQGNADEDARLTCVLSVSTTHDGLHALVKEYFEDEFNSNSPWGNLNIFLFSEDDCRLLVKDVLQPLAKIFYPSENSDTLYEIFGVDGEYGRHYSFLKAIAAFWQVFIDPDIKATFKIDLDQVFDQDALLKETGQTALEHFKTDLWGAEASDSWGNPVYLGMIAGALVNHDDIDKSLFTPDVKYPDTRYVQPDELIFYSRLPQALSTAAEMMCRYTDPELNGVQKSLQRVHVTGGTNGILLKALRTYRPFTPLSIGRAEDQAYLLSVLFEKQPYLRYLHKPGLIMRHDKQAFAQEAIKAAASGKLIGDYVRIFQFSFYARALPWSLEKIKEMVDPFTGCFITPISFTIVYLRFTFKVLSLIESGAYEQAEEFMKLGAKRLLPWVRFLSVEDNPLQEQFFKERRGWNLYYDILDKTEKAFADNDPHIELLKRRADEIICSCFMEIQG